MTSHRKQQISTWIHHSAPINECSLQLSVSVIFSDVNAFPLHRFLVLTIRLPIVEVAETISRLDSYWHVLESDVLQLSKDIGFCEKCMSRYGDVFAVATEHLKVGRFHLAALRFVILNWRIQQRTYMPFEKRYTPSLTHGLNSRDYVQIGRKP